MAVSTPSDLLALVRRELADEVSPYLWSDADLYYYMDEAQKEFARETKCITDGVTFTEIDVEADEPWIPLDPAIVDIKRAILTTKKTVLKPITVEDLSHYAYRDDYGWRFTDAWETRTGSPTHLILNADKDNLRLYPIPTADDSLDLTVWREPIHSIDSSDSVFEIPKRWFRKLLHGILAQCYNRQDYETFDADSADRQLAMWEREMLKAASHEKRRHRRPRPVAYGGY